jgi:hypothetical protein
MRLHLFPVLLIVMAIGGATDSSPPVKAASEVAQIDFVGLHDQASSALQMLKVSQERRIALQQTAEAAF